MDLAEEPVAQGTQLRVLGIDPDGIEELIDGLRVTFPKAAQVALQAWGPEILAPLGLETEEKLIKVLEELPARIKDLFDRVRRQVGRPAASTDLRYSGVDRVDPGDL